jgi:hypothetical protein
MSEDDMITLTLEAMPAEPAAMMTKRVHFKMNNTSHHLFQSNGACIIIVSVPCMVSIFDAAFVIRFQFRNKI